MPQQFCTTAYTSTAGTNYYVPTWTSNTTSYTLTNQVVWTNWNNATTISTQQITQQTNGNYRWTDDVWQQWVVTYPQTSYIQTPAASYVETPEQRAERQRHEQARHEERVAARTRARVLLGEFLSDEQKADLERHGRFHVTGSRGRRYCIRAEGQAGNVDLLKPDGSLQARLCCHPRQGLPDGDAWLVQMIEIRHDEDHFLRTANVHRGSLPVAA